LTDRPTYSIQKIPELKEASLVVGWTENAAGLGSSTIEYLNKKLGGREFAEINPERFYQLGGVTVDKDVAQFPDNKFYYCQEKNLVLLKGSAPQMEWYAFLNTVLDVVEKCCPIREIYTIGGMVSMAAHTAQRTIVATANTTHMKSILREVGLNGSMDYETPPSQRPTLSSYLLWVAQGRGINGACVWVPVPFYLTAVQDISAGKKAIEFFDKRFALELNLQELEENVMTQDQQIAKVLQRYPELNAVVSRLESNLSLTEEESNMLAEIMENQLGRQGLQ
jgi:proteasome assembly chaperone (PAC2) family protein